MAKRRVRKSKQAGPDAAGVKPEIGKTVPPDVTPVAGAVSAGKPKVDRKVRKHLRQIERQVADAAQAEARRVRRLEKARWRRQRLEAALDEARTLFSAKPPKAAKAPKPATKPAAKAAPKAAKAPKPAAKAAEAATKPAEATKPAVKPAVKPAAKAAVKPAAKPAAKRGEISGQARGRDEVRSDRPECHGEGRDQEQPEQGSRRTGDRRRAACRGLLPAREEARPDGRPEAGGHGQRRIRVVGHVPELRGCALQAGQPDRPLTVGA